MGQFVHNGVLYEEMPNGQAKVIGPAPGAQQPAFGPAIGGNPKLPGELASQGLSNQRTKQEIAQAAATAAATTRKANADATTAEIAAKNAQDAYTAAHPKGPSGSAFGPEALKSMSVPDQDIVKALGEGRLAFPGGFAMKSPFWQQKLEQVAQVYPDFDATNFNNRAKARAMLLNGKVGASSNSLNASMGHLGLLQSQIGGTASHGDFPFATTLNSLENWYSRKEGDPGVTNFEDTAGKLASELASTYRNGGGAEQDVIRQLQSLDPSMSLKQKQGIIRNAIELLASKQAANIYQYGLGDGGKANVDLLDPAAHQVLDQFPDIRDKYFVAPPQLGQQAVALIKANGGTPPDEPPGAQGGGFAPPPTGPTDGGMGPSSGGSTNLPDPKDSEFWNDAIRSGVPYGAAIKTWQSAHPDRSLQTPPDPEAYNKASDYVKAHPNIPYAPVQSILQKPLTGVGGVMNGVAQSGPGAFAGHFSNAALAGIPGAVAGDQGRYFNAVSGQQNPGLSTAGDIAGTVLGAATVNKGLGKLAPYLGKIGEAATANPMRQGLIADTMFGGGSGAIQNPDHPLVGAAVGGGSMAAGNVAGRFILGPALAAAGDTAAGQSLVNGGIKLGNKARGMFGGAQSPTFSPPAPLDSGQALLMNGMSGKNSPIADIRTNLNDAANLGLPYSLADADPRLRVLAGSAVRKSPDVRALAENTIAPRQRGQAERAVSFIDQHLAPVGDVPTMQANILKDAQTQSKPLYQQAKSQPVPDLAHYPEFRAVLDRPAGQAAIRKGYEAALNRGEDVGTLTYATDPNGNPVSYGNPSWNVIHYARQALDEAGEADVRNALDKQISLINPGFKAADAAYAGALKGSDALQAGSAATGIKVTPEATQRALSGFPNNVSHFQQGFASSLADTAERARFTADPYNVVAGSPAQIQKMGIVFPQGVGQFGRAQALEGDMSRTGTELLGGSPTAARMESDKLFENPVADGALELGLMAATGTPPKGLIKKGLQYVADGRSLGFRGAKQKADQIGPILLNTDPQAGLNSLDSLSQINLARKAYLDRVRAAGGMFAAPITYGSLQRN